MKLIIISLQTFGIRGVNVVSVVDFKKKFQRILINN